MDEWQAPDLLAQLRATLQAAGLGPESLDIAPHADPEGRVLAAALVLLYPWCTATDAPFTPHLVLTRRPTTLRSHSGQISLPGGRFDPEDVTLLRTALRESEEELGIDAAHLTVWGQLTAERTTVSNYAIAPFVAFSPRRPSFVPAPAEVAEVIDFPLALLLDPDGLDEETWELQDVPRRVSFYRHGEHKVWGATARILGKLASLLVAAPAEPGTQPGAGAAGERRRLAPGQVWPAMPRRSAV